MIASATMLAWWMSTLAAAIGFAFLALLAFFFLFYLCLRLCDLRDRASKQQQATANNRKKQQATASNSKQAASKQQASERASKQ